MKVWKSNDIYNVASEFNRIESYNEYCKDWFKNYYGISVVDFVSNTNWVNTDVPDIKDFNRIKTNINYLLEIIGKAQRLTISSQVNQVLNDTKVNEIEQRLNDYLQELGEWQFAYDITGLAITGNAIRLGGVE